MKDLSRHNLIPPNWIFLLSIIVSLFWIFANGINIYSSVITGFVFEILWLPMLALLFIIPVASIIYWVKSRFKFNSLYFFALMVIAATVATIIITSN